MASAMGFVKQGQAHLYYLGTSFPITPAFSVDAEGFHQRFHDSANKAWMFAARGTYAFSSRTSVYATAGYIDNCGNLTLSSMPAKPAPTPMPVGANSAPWWE